MTQEKSFDELFPELEEFEIDCRDIIEDFATHSLVKNVIHRVQTRVSEEVKKHCLSKQRVSEAIEKLQMAYPSSYGTFNCSINVNELKRKLGLE